jgi:hypothetical protein
MKTVSKGGVVFSIRPATFEDAALILKFIKELAEYEQAPQEVTATVHCYETTLFAKDCPRPDH